ncbi:HNH endonuclease [uncultured archaeon]|nr:HNH endonuclease [uncultured archaeon]
MEERDKTLRRKAFERNKFTCQKCKIQDKTGKILEAHHITPIYSGGKDILDNVITLCNDCHHFASNSKQEFDEYLKEEMDGTLTTLMKAWEKVISENPDLK